MNVILSINPIYVERIISKEKKFEFRKSLFQHHPNSKIYIYSTDPIKKIIGYFNVGKVIKDNPRRLWQECKSHSGINRKNFFEYFCNKEYGYAIGIERLILFNNAIEPKNYFMKFTPPQSFAYLDEEIKTYKKFPSYNRDNFLDIY